MPISESGPDPSAQFYTQVDDEQYGELCELANTPVVHVSVWEESLADAIEPGPAATTTAVDLDLYLRDGVYFELFGVVCYPHPDADPMTELAAIEQYLTGCVKEGLALAEVAVDEEDGLVLVLAQRGQPVLYLQVGAWLLDEWQELPDDTAS